MEDRNTDWLKFFKECGIPSSLASKYAVTFSNHRIQLNMLRDLNKEILYDMGIKTIGDVIAILRHAKEVDEEAEKVQVLGKQINSDRNAIKLNKKETNIEQIKSSAKRSLPEEKVEETNFKKIMTTNQNNQKQDGSIEYLSRGSTYVIKMPNFATSSPASPTITNTYSQKSSIFSRLGDAPNTGNVNTQKHKITAPAKMIQTSNNLPSTSSVFNRLGNEKQQDTASQFNNVIISRNKNVSNQSSVLRGAEGSNIFSGKATATVKPTNLLVRKSASQQVNVISTRPGIKNRIGVVTQVNEPINTMRSIKHIKTITPQIIQTRGQTISLKKSVFDRLGPSRS